MRVLIVDDEPLARARLVRLLAQFPEHQCVGTAENTAQAWQLLQQTEPEVVLLDIEMPNEDGISFGCRINQTLMPPALIFVTAHPIHALGAFQANPADYLLKPVDVNQLRQALDKAGRLTRAQIAIKPLSQPISFVQQGIRRQVPVHDVYYIVAEDKYSRIVYRAGEALLDTSLVTLEQHYAESLLRIHRSTLVNVAMIVRLFSDKNSKHYVQLQDVAITLEVSRRSLSRVKQVLQGA